MNHRIQYIAFALLVLGITAFTFTQQHTYPQDYFRSPVDYAMKLSGTFGELRPNHFHAGIDIKPLKGVGDNIYAVADGYVSRVKALPNSYGNVVYIDHPNGYTSVYAHLYKYNDTIAKYVKKRQYEKQQFRVDLYPAAGEIAFKKGDLIGYMGTSGRSFGTHLHFEIRNTKTEKAINPLLFGLKLADDVAPRITQLKVYSLTPELRELESKKFDIKKGKYGYYVGGDTLRVGAWRVGLALKAFDFMNNVSNWNGIYSMEMYVDDSLHYSFQMNEISFDETRYINAHCDYGERVTNRSYFNRCYRLPGNRLSVYDNMVDEGVIELEKNRAKKIEYIVKDSYENTSKLRFYIRRAEVKPQDVQQSYNYLLPYTERNLIQNGDFEVDFPKGTFYEDLYLNYQVSYEKSDDTYSPIYHLGDRIIPMHRYFTVGIRPVDLPEHLRDKAVIASCPEGLDEECLSGHRWEGDMLKATTRELGNLTVMLDTIAPSIKVSKIANTMKKNYRMIFNITDDFSGIKSYRATVDDEWILMEYDEKNDQLTHRFDGRIPKGKHRLVLTVEDARGNVATYKKSFGN